MRIVVIGNRSKPLTYHVVNGIINSEKYSLELVVLKKPQPKPKNEKKNILFRTYNFLKKNGIKGLINKLYSRIAKPESNFKVNVKELCVSKNINYWEDFDLNSIEVSQTINSV